MSASASGSGTSGSGSGSGASAAETAKAKAAAAAAAATTASKLWAEQQTARLKSVTRDIVVGKKRPRDPKADFVDAFSFEESNAKFAAYVKGENQMYLAKADAAVKRLDAHYATLRETPDTVGTWDILCRVFEAETFHATGDDFEYRCLIDILENVMDHVEPQQATDRTIPYASARDLEKTPESRIYGHANILFGLAYSDEFYQRVSRFAQIDRLASFVKELKEFYFPVLIRGMSLEKAYRVKGADPSWTMLAGFVVNMRDFYTHGTGPSNSRANMAMATAAATAAAAAIAAAKPKPKPKPASELKKQKLTV